MDDKIKVSLELDTSQVEPKVNAAQKLLNAIKTTLGNISKTGIKPQIDTKQAEARIKYLKQKIQDMQKSKIYGGMIVDENALSNATKELNYWQDAMKDVSSETDNVSDEMEDVEEHTEKVHKKAGLIQRAFSRVGISLRNQISTSLAHMINPLTAARKVVDIMRQSFEYLTNVITPRLGASFSNIKNNFFEYIANTDVFKNLINGALKFIYLLQQIFNVFANIFGWTKLDLFKTSLKTAKQLQKLQSQMVAGFDEINDIGGGNGQAQQDATPLGLGELIPKDEQEKLNNIAKKFEGIAETSKKIYEFLKKWGTVILVAIAGLVIVISLIKLYNSLGKVKTNPLNSMQEGVGKLASGAGKALEFIAILGGLALVFKALSELVLAFKDNTDSLGAVVTVLAVTFAGIATTMLLVSKLGPSLTAGLAPFGILIAEISAILIVMALTLPTILEACGKFIKDIGPVLIEILTTIFDGIGKIVDIIGKNLTSIIDVVGNKIIGIINSISFLVVTIGDTIVKTIDGIFNAIINFISKLGPAINKLVDNIIKALTKVFNFFTKGFETIVNNGVTAINWLFSPLRKVGNFVLEKVGLGDFKFDPISKLKGLTYLDVGTNYVPNDQLAMIHQGEAVIPKKFNDRTFFGGGNEETNALLETLIDRIDNIDFSPYTTIKDVGKASVEYIKDTSRQLGKSVI